MQKIISSIYVLLISATISASAFGANLVDECNRKIAKSCFAISDAYFKGEGVKKIMMLLMSMLIKRA